MLFFVLLVLCQVISIQVCLRIMRARHVIARDRWICSLLIFCCPLIGLFIYAAFRQFVSEKQYRFFSEAFIEQHLS